MNHCHVGFAGLSLFLTEDEKADVVVSRPLRSLTRVVLLSQAKQQTLVSNRFFLERKKTNNAYQSRKPLFNKNENTKVASASQIE